MTRSPRRLPPAFALAAGLLLALLLTAAAASPALAHKIKIFATAEGTTITGYVYFPGGSRPAGAPVTVTGPDGSVLAEMTTDADGAFRYEAVRRMDHTFTVDTGDGHRGSFLVRAAQLPRSLPGDAAPGAIAGDFTAGGGGAAAGAAGGALAAFDAEMLEDTIARAVAREVNPLREQLEAYEEKVRLHDILGGLGWIAGLTGIAFYILARRRSGSGG